MATPSSTGFMGRARQAYRAAVSVAQGAATKTAAATGALVSKTHAAAAAALGALTGKAGRAGKALAHGLTGLVVNKVPGVKTAVLATTVLNRARKAIDSTNSVQKITTIDKKLRVAFHHVHPSLVQPSQVHFGNQALHDLHALTAAGLKKFTGWKRFAAQRLIDTSAVAHTVALGSVNFIADRARATMPDGDAQARKVFGEGIARDLDYALTQVSDCVQRARAHGGDWRRPGFEAHVDAELTKSPLAQAQGTVDAFYHRLTTRIIQEMDQAMASASTNTPTIQMLQSLNALIDYRDPTQRYDFLFDLLKKLHEEMCDPTRVKQLLMEVLESTSDSLDLKLTNYLQMIQGPTAPVSAPSVHDDSYGHALMSVLQTLQPRALGFNIMGVYAKFHAQKLPLGTDFLSEILRDTTGDAIARMMAPNTDQWIAGALRLAKANLLDRSGALDDKPGYVLQADWDKFDAIQRAAARDATQGLGKKLKDEHIARINAKFSQSTERIAKGVLRAGFVADQFFKSAAQRSQDMSRTKAYRVFWSIIAFIVGLPGIRHLLWLLRQINVRIRLLFADLGAYAAGKSLSNRVDAMLKTESMQRVWMHMLEKSLEHIHILSPSVALTAGTPIAAPGTAPAPVAPLPVLATTGAAVAAPAGAAAAAASAPTAVAGATAAPILLSGATAGAAAAAASALAPTAAAASVLTSSLAVPASAPIALSVSSIAQPTMVPIAALAVAPVAASGSVPSRSSTPTAALPGQASPTLSSMVSSASLSDLTDLSGAATPPSPASAVSSDSGSTMLASLATTPVASMPATLTPGTYLGTAANGQLHLMLQAVYAHNPTFATSLKQAFLGGSDLVSFTYNPDGTFSVSFQAARSVVTPKQGLKELQNYKITRAKTLTGRADFTQSRLELAPGSLHFSYYTSKFSMTSLSCTPADSNEIVVGFNSWTGKTQRYDRAQFLACVANLMP